MSTLTVQNLKGVSPSNQITVASGHKLYAPGGIVQVQSTTKTDTFSMTSMSYTDVTGLSVNITPTSTSSKIFVMVRACGAGVSTVTRTQLRVLRDSTPIGIGDAASNRDRVSMNEFYTAESDMFLGSAFHHLDSPATTSTITYKLQIRCGNTTAGAFLNRNQSDTDAAYIPRGSSSITVWEIAQ